MSAPLDTVPLFLRADAVLPLAGPAQHTEELDWVDRTVLVPLAGPGRVELTG